MRISKTYNHCHILGPPPGLQMTPRVAAFSSYDLSIKNNVIDALGRDLKTALLSSPSHIVYFSPDESFHHFPSDCHSAKAVTITVMIVTR